MLSIIVVILSLVVIALLRSYFQWIRSRSLLMKVSRDLEPSEATVALIFLKMRIYESFHRIVTKRGGAEEFLRDVGMAMKEVLDSDAWSVILTHENGKWYFAAWDNFYDKKDLDEIIPHIQKSGGARLVFEKKEVLDIPNTSKKKFWRDIIELVEKREGRTFETRSWIGVPVISEGKVVAVISIDWFTPRAYKKWMIDILKVLTDDLSKAFQSMKDISDIMTFEDYDPLFGLPGEKALMRDLEKLKSSGAGFSIIIVEITNTRRIWQLYGQIVKGKAMKKVVRRLRGIFEGHVRMYSKSSNEVVIILETLSHQLLISYQRKILGEFLRVFRIDNDENPVFVKLSAKVGYAIYPEDGDNISELFETAKRREILY